MLPPALRERARLYSDILRHAWRAGELDRLLAAPVMLTCGDDDRGYEVAGMRYAQILDSLNELVIAAGFSTMTIPLPYSAIHGPMAFGRVCAAHGEFARAELKDRLARLGRLQSSPAASPRVSAWRRILAAVRPKIVIGIQPPPELCLAAKASGIPVADLQHGLLSDEGYYGNAFRKRFGQDGWPDWILCWDEPSARWAEAHLPAGVRTRVIGNPWLLRFDLRANADELMQAAASLPLPPDRGRPKLLVTLQWGLDKAPGYHESGMPASLAEAIRQSPEYDWWVRLHPMQLVGPVRKELYAALQRDFGAGGNVFWTACSEAPLPLVLRHAYLHLTSHSAVALEASCVGMRTALLDQRHDLLREWLGEYIAAGSADLVPDSARAIRSWIDASLRAGRLPATSFTGRAGLDSFLASLGNSGKP